MIRVLGGGTVYSWKKRVQFFSEIDRGGKKEPRALLLYLNFTLAINFGKKLNAIVPTLVFTRPYYRAY